MTYEDFIPIMNFVDFDSQNLTNSILGLVWKRVILGNKLLVPHSFP